MRSWGIKKMAESFNISEYQLRQIDKINDLRPDVQRLVGAGELGIDASYQLSRLSGELQSKAAKEAKEMTEQEIRPFVQLLANDQNMTIGKAKKVVEESKKKRLNILFLPLTETTFKSLKALAGKEHQPIHDFALSILENYIAKEEKD